MQTDLPALRPVKFRMRWFRTGLPELQLLSLGSHATLEDLDRRNDWLRRHGIDPYTVPREVLVGRWVAERQIVIGLSNQPCYRVVQLEAAPLPFPAPFCRNPDHVEMSALAGEPDD